MPVIEVESGATDEAYPELFDTRTMLPQPKDKKPGQISDDLIRKYFEDVSFVFNPTLIMSVLCMHALICVCFVQCILHFHVYR